MSEEYKGEQIPNKEVGDKIDEIFLQLEDNPRKAFEMYLNAEKEVQKWAKELPPSGGIIINNPDIQVDLIMKYIIAKFGGDELGMKRIRLRSGCNPQTKTKLDEIDEPDQSTPEE